MQFKVFFHRVLFLGLSQLSAPGGAHLCVLVDNPPESTRRNSDCIIGFLYPRFVIREKAVAVYLYNFYEEDMHGDWQAQKDASLQLPSWFPALSIPVLEKCSILTPE